jgi:hypothetical protein
LKLKALLVLAISTSAACTTFTPIEVSSDEIQQRVVSGDLIHARDNVRIVTLDGSIHEFRVTQVDTEKGLVFGKDGGIAINEIRAVEKRRLDVGKTARRTGWGFLIFVATNGYFCC